MAAAAAAMALLVAAAPAAAKADAPGVDARGGSAANAAPGAPDGPQGVHPFEVEGYSRDFGVSRATAEKRLETQRRGGDIVGQLQDELGHDYAGVWFDNESGEFVVPVLSESDQRALHTGKATASIQGEYRAAAAQYSWEELEAAQERLDEELDGPLREGFVQTSRSARANALIIHVAADASAKQRAQLARVAKNSDVRVQLRDEDLARLFVKPRDCEPVWRDCGLPLRGGVRIGIHNHAEHCSAGFRARGKSNGRMYLISAGHCFKNRDEPTLYWDAWNQNNKRTYIGEAQGVSFPPPGQSSQGDWGMIDTTGSEWTTAPWPAMVAYWGEGYDDESVIDGEYPIDGEAKSVEGEYVCHSGFASGTSCGHVYETGTTVHFETGETVYNETRVGGPKGSEHCNIGGDSGGPWFAGNTALGINSAGANWVYDVNDPIESWYKELECEDQVSWYSEITDATKALNVKIAPIPDAPEVVTGAASGFPSPRQAFVTGSVDPNGASTTYHFEYGTTTAYGSSTAPVGPVTGWEPQPVLGTLKGLKGSTYYHFRLVAQNERGTTYGEDAYFLTPLWPPVVTIQPQTGVGVYSEVGKATLHGTVNPEGEDTHYRFQWGKGGAFNQSIPIPDADLGSGTSAVPVEQQIEGLKGLTEYRFRILAYSNQGSTTSSVHSFTTPDWRPAIESESHSNVHVDYEEEIGKADLEGQVNPNGFATHYRVEWGDSEEFSHGEYNHRVPAGEDAPLGNCVCGEAVKRTIAGIKGLTTYHFRLVAENTEGTTVGGDRSFTTPDWRPHITLEAADDVRVEEETGKADLHAHIHPEGFKTFYRFEWGTQAEYEEGEYNHVIPVPDAKLSVTYSYGEIVTQTIAGLKGETTYHFRAVAENAEGKSPNEEEESFTTPDWRPKLWTVNVGRIGGHEATLEARIESSGFDTHYHFEWGTQAEYEEGEYGHSVPAPDGDAGSEQEYVEVSHTLEGLKTHRAYHFRLVAENAEGSRTDPGSEFTTWRSAFSVEKSPATIVPPAGAWFYLGYGGEGVMECGGSGFEDSLASSSEVLLMSPPEALHCKSFGAEVPLEMNGCRFEFDPGPQQGGGGYDGEFSIGPPGCGPITTEVVAACSHLSIPSQIGLAAIYGNAGEGSERKVTVTPRSYSVGLAGQGGCGEYHTDKAAIEGKGEGWATRAEDSEEAVGFSVKTLLDGQTEEATGASGSEATLHATVYPVGSKTSYYFQYGTSAEYGETTAIGHIEAGAEEPVEVSAHLEGLDPETTYHFRVLALGAGALTGEDQSFTTEALHPARFDADAYPASISGANDVAYSEFYFDGEGGVKCGTAEFSGSLSEPSQSLDLGAEYGECHWSESEPTQIRMNSCRYALGANDAGPPYSAGYGIACAEEGDAIEVEFFLDFGEGPASICTASIPAQSIGGSLNVAGEGEGGDRQVNVSGALFDVHYTAAGEYCEFVAEPGSHEDGVLEVDTTLAAASGEETAGLYLTGGTAPEGLFVNGEEEIAAEAYPASVAGAQAAGTDIVLEEASVECGEAGLSGSISAATQALPLDAQYGGCGVSEIEGMSAQVDLNSCHYVLGPDIGGPYTGSYGVACDEEGDAIEVDVSYEGLGHFCTMFIPPAEGQGPVSMSTAGSGTGRTIHVTGSAYASYTTDGSELCGLLVPEEGDARFELDASLGATYLG
jgi:hypothetical protein